MSGEARTSAFLLGTATVMLGTPAQLYDLNPYQHSIGLVKNFRMMSDPNFTELTHGVTNTLVFSVATGETAKASFEVYEYTAKNMAWGLGINGANGSGLGPKSINRPLSTAYVAETDPAVLTASTLQTSDFTAGDWVMIQAGLDDQCHVRKVVSKTSTSITVNAPLPVALPVGTVISAVNKLDIADKQNRQFFVSMKIVGSLADGTEVVIMVPKCRVTKGFSVGFITDNFDNMPFEMALYDQLPTDPYFADFPGQAGLFTRK